MIYLFFILIPVILLLFITTYTDLKYRIIHDQTLFYFLCYFIVVRLCFHELSLMTYVFGFFTASSILYVFALISAGSVGGGDIKLLAVLGFVLGWQLSLLLLLGSLLLILFWNMVHQRQLIAVPLAPFVFTSFLILQCITFYVF